MNVYYQCQSNLAFCHNFINNWIHILVSDPKSTVSDVLKQTVVPLFEQSDCKSKLGSAYDESFICAGGQKGEDACEGDGGGPLVCSLTNSRDEQYVQVSFDQISHNFLLQICCVLIVQNEQIQLYVICGRNR